MRALLLPLVVSLFFCSYSSAQVSNTTGPSQSGDILILGNGWTGNVSQCTHNYNCWAGSSDQGDIHHGYDRSTGMGNTYYWSGTQQTLSNTIAINTALSAAGIQVDGFEYEWVYKNGNANWFSGQPGGGAVDPFEIVVNVYDSTGSLFKSYKYDFGNQFSNWRTVTGTETFNQNFLTPSYFGNVVVEVTGVDIAGQAGYWGPEFRADQSHLYVNYSNNPCHNNQLYDPQCPGYATALFNQQCQLNALYDPSCPGYATAYLNQQCTINVLYDPACPGYQTAYYNQQCTNDPLSDPGCPDYFVAQCEKDPLYDMGCVGYDTAYFDQQCGLDAQYDTMCPGYVDFSGNDDVVVILDPIIDDAINVETEPELFEQEIPVYEFEYKEEVVEVETDMLDFDESIQKLEDDIEKEIAQLEQEGENGDGELNLEDDIESEIAKLESESTDKDFDDPTLTSGEENMEDDIEKEIAKLEDAASEDESEPVDEKEVQVADNNDGSNTLERPGGKKLQRKNNNDSSTSSRRDKMRMLIAAKAVETTRELERAVTLEQQMDIQRRLLALISFVPDFKDEYTKNEVPQVNFYPPKPVVDHAYARWFLNDPNFAAMENLQYEN